MQSQTILLLVVTFCISFGIAYFQYFFKKESIQQYIKLLFVLRGLAFFLIFLVLINPIIKRSVFEDKKPVLSILVDNSKSLQYFNEEKNIIDFKNTLAQNSKLKEKFNVQVFSFGENLLVNDSLSFFKTNTNIYKALLEANRLQENKIAPLVLLTDGNQTLGRDYEFFSSKQNVYPVVFGDTVSCADVEITQLNVNKYSFLKNKFPVELLLNYSGKERVVSRLTIQEKGRTIFSKSITFSEKKSSQKITANLTSNSVGNHFYSVNIQPLNNEKNTQNNTKNFAVEVIDNQTKVLLVYETLHPDLGALKKAIESNKQRKITYCQIDNFKNQTNDYQLFILFNVNNRFTSVLDRLKKKNKNYFLITGTSTDWNFINQQDLGFRKSVVNDTEFFIPIYNSTYSVFLQPDLGFASFAPLEDFYGNITVSNNAAILLYQQISGVETKQPLLFTIENNNQKSGVLLGEGIWKWRANSFLNSNSFSDFDNFIGNLVQYLSSNKKRDRLDVSIKSIYKANETINVSAFYTDKNYRFDDRATIEIQLKNKSTGDYFTIPFSLNKNSYQVALENLPSGEYEYKVLVNNTTISKSGTFKITAFEIEAQFTNANISKLQQLAKNSKGKLFYKDKISQLEEELLTNKSYYTIRKEKIDKQKLIDWKWVLLLIVSLLATEWFVRKYYGKI